MNMNKALQNLYHAVSGSTTTKVNISKLLVDIHYAITGKESAVKNNWSRIIDSMATNWPEGGGGGGSSDFSTAEVTVVGHTNEALPLIFQEGALGEGSPACLYTVMQALESGIYNIPLYKGSSVVEIHNVTDTSGSITNLFETIYLITGDCTITIT